MLSVKLDALQSKARRLLVPGVIATLPWGRGSGKSYFGRTCIHEWALEKRRHIGLLMPTLKQARAVFWPLLLGDYYADATRTDDDGNVIGGLKDFVRRPNLTELVCEYKNGSRLTTWGAENANSIRGQRFDRLVQDESDDIDPEVERAIVEPTFSKSGTNAIWLKTGTPKRGRYGSLYLGFQRGQEGSRERQALRDAGIDPSCYVSFRCRSSESPQVNQAWLERVRKDLTASGRKTTWQREYEVEFDAAEGLVYSDFEHHIHVAEPDYDTVWSEILVGIDHGFEDPQVFIVIGVIGSGRDAICWILEEFYGRHHQHSELQAEAIRIREKYAQRAPIRWFADPSRPDMIKMYRGIGCWVEPGNNAIEDGVLAVADRMYPRETGVLDSAGHMIVEPRLYVSPTCENTIAEFGMYRRKRDPKDAERVLDAIEDKNNHAMDAVRYPIFTRFGSPRLAIKQEDPYGGDEGQTA